MKEINNINSILEMPKEVYTNEPKIIVKGFNELIIENYKSILEYEDCYIKLATHMGNININGVDLSLAKMTEDNLKIIGKIQSIDIKE